MIFAKLIFPFVDKDLLFIKPGPLINPACRKLHPETP